MSFDASISILTASLIGPLVAGLVALFGGQRPASNKLVQWLLVVSSGAGLYAAYVLLIGFLVGDLSPTTFKAMGFPFEMRIDALSSFFLILIQVGTMLVSLFALGYLPKHAKTYSLPSLNFASALFIFGMQATVLAHSIFGFLLCWEIMSVAAYFLVIADREEASIKAGTTYFVMTHLGFACLLAGLLILVKGDASAVFEDLNGLALPGAMPELAFFLMFAGFGSKAGLVPLHQWLPQAHPQAPSHSSALMSGVMLKVALYGFLRMAFSSFPGIPLTWAIIVVIVGLLSAFFGVLSAAVETDLKRLLAWSSIENLGLLFAMIGTGLAFTTMRLDGTMFFVAAFLHALNHTVFKSGLFMAAGAIISETHTRDLDAMGGLAKPWPALSMAFLGLMLAAVALPPFGTFYGELLFLQGLASGMLAVHSRSVVIALGAVISVTALVGGLAIFTFVKTFSSIFLSKPRSSYVEHVNPLGAMLVVPVALTAVFSLCIGIGAPSIVSFVSSTSDPAWPRAGTSLPLYAFLFFVAALMVAYLTRRFLTSRRPIRLTDTWDCGQQITSRMEYTATGFAAPIRFFFRSILLSEKSLVTERVVPGNPWVLRRRFEGKMGSLWEKWLYAPVVAAISALSERIRRLQNGVIQTYILFILVTLVIALIFAV